LNRTRLARPRITERLVERARYPITAIIAPAGFGKSVALSDYLQAQLVEHLRYDVRADQNTLFEFVRGLAKTLQPRVPAALASFAGAQERAMAADNAVADLSSWLLEHLKTAMTIVIDDLHNAAEDPRSIAFLANVVERSHQHVRWIIASRSALSLPTASWVAYEKMGSPIDETDLCFTLDEALAAAEDSVPAEQSAAELLELTSGWPVAFSIALRTSARLADLQKLAAGTRDMIYQYLAEQVYERLPDGQRLVLLETCVYPSLDRTIIEQRGDNPDVLNQLRRDAGFIYSSSDEEFRYHDLFREFLENELRAKGESVYRNALCAAAKTLEALERNAEALSLFVRANDIDQTVRLIEQAGFDLIDRGRTDVVEAALVSIPEERRAVNSLALGMDALLASRRGRSEIAQERYKVAIERSTRTAVRAELAYRYAIDLVRLGRSEAVDVLKPFVDDESLKVSLRAAILAALATAHIKASNPQAAKSIIEQALTLLERSPNAILRARIYQQASFVLFFSGEPERGRAYANSAIEIAAAHGVFEIAARAYSLLYNIANDIDDDTIAILRNLEQIEVCARKAGSRQMQLFAFLGQYDVEAERGDEAALARLDEEIDAMEMTLPGGVMESLLPARALRAAWNGEFTSSYRLLRDTAEKQETGERRALRWAEIAVYANACNATADGEHAIENAYAEVRSCEHLTPRLMRTSLFLAIAELIRGREVAAHRLTSDVEKALQPSNRRLRALTRAVRALYNSILSPENHASFAASIERLRAEHLGGIARLLSRLPIEPRDSGGLAALTASERAILRALVSGASSKLIASETGRSAQTVDVHIRSICRKLGCSGRIEAIAVALKAGWSGGESNLNLN
jgi:ATP/maltotriose-dependent transcriptional regulator MalT